MSARQKLPDALRIARRASNKLQAFDLQRWAAGVLGRKFAAWM
jgi:hypothetical protein